MDFNAIFETISPYLGTGGIATAVIGILAIVVKLGGLIKTAKKTFSSTHNEAVEAFKQALPKELYISLETIAKEELAKIKTEFTNAVEEKFINQIKANTELVQEIAKALCTLKAIPDSVKLEIAKLLDIEKPDTTESLKVELLPTHQAEVKTIKAKKVESISID